MHSFIIAITTFTAYLLILTIDIVPYQLENHLLIVILSIESIVSIHSLQLYQIGIRWEDIVRKYGLNSINLGLK